MHIQNSHLHQFEQRYRARLVNSLSGFKSANLIGTENNLGQTNLAIVSSVFHLGADPALMGMIIRPHSTARHTLENIQQLGEYTINHVSADFWQQAHQTSARYLQAESEFAKTGLTEEYLAECKAPFVQQSRLKFSLAHRETISLAINGTELVIGEINDIFVERKALKPDGYIDIELLDSIAISGLDSYHTTRHLGRLSYAKPDKALESLTLDGNLK